MQGNLPESEADQLLQVVTIDATPSSFKPKSRSDIDMMDPEMQVRYVGDKFSLNIFYSKEMDWAG